MGPSSLYALKFAPAMVMDPKGSEVKGCNEGISGPEIQKSVPIEMVVFPSVAGVLAPFLDSRIQTLQGRPFQAGVSIAPHTHHARECRVVGVEAPGRREPVDGTAIREG